MASKNLDDKLGDIYDAAIAQIREVLMAYVSEHRKYPDGFEFTREDERWQIEAAESSGSPIDFMAGEFFERDLSKLRPVYICRSASGQRYMTEDSIADVIEGEQV